MAGALSFEDGLRLVPNVRWPCRSLRSRTRYDGGDPGTRRRRSRGSLRRLVDGVVVAVGYNCPGQLVIARAASKPVDAACANSRRRAPTAHCVYPPTVIPRPDGQDQFELEERSTPTPPNSSSAILQDVDANPDDQRRSRGNRDRLVHRFSVRWTCQEHAYGRCDQIYGTRSRQCPAGSYQKVNPSGRRVEIDVVTRLRKQNRID